ncbi:MAG: UDP-N-acetylglucosamine 2-epimerase, partial [Clostridia bacterium]|nr:UDP-N-acetylglucosamine 2-epimerase [Clostridia bacterium]
EPMPPDVFYRHLATSAAVLTDSGGLQEECAEMGIPIIVLRRETEREEELSLGKIILSPNIDKAFSTLTELIYSAKKERTVSVRYGASRKIAEILSGITLPV